MRPIISLSIVVFIEQIWEVAMKEGRNSKTINELAEIKLSSNARFRGFFKVTTLESQKCFVVGGWQPQYSVRSNGVILK